MGIEKKSQTFAAFNEPTIIFNWSFKILRLNWIKFESEKGLKGSKFLEWFDGVEIFLSIPTWQNHRKKSELLAFFGDKGALAAWNLCPSPQAAEKKQFVNDVKR